MVESFGANVGSHPEPKPPPEGWHEAKVPVYDNDQLANQPFMEILPPVARRAVEVRRAARRQARREHPPLKTPIRRTRAKPHERAPRARARASSCDTGERGDPEPAPPPSLFDRLHTVTPTLTGPQRMTLFYSLPPKVQEAAWRDLARRTERERAA